MFGDSGTKSLSHREKRRSPRFVLNLPLDFKLVDTSQLSAGIVINGGEGGLLINSLENIPVGSKLEIDVLFPSEFELANFAALAEVVRKDRREKGQFGYRCALKLVQINQKDHLKLRNLLRAQSELLLAQAIQTPAKQLTIVTNKDAWTFTMKE